MSNIRNNITVKRLFNWIKILTTNLILCTTAMGKKKHLCFSRFFSYFNRNVLNSNKNLPFSHLFYQSTTPYTSLFFHFSQKIFLQFVLYIRTNRRCKWKSKSQAKQKCLQQAICIVSGRKKHFTLFPLKNFQYKNCSGALFNNCENNLAKQRFAFYGIFIFTEKKN